MSSHEHPLSPSHDTRIEQLLLAGLDRYFAGEFERAIQVWSRVFFLDRGHPRARAYIDRARGALAERQREAEARLHRPDGAPGGPADQGVTGAVRLPELSEPDAAGDGARPRPALPGATAATFARAPVATDAGHLAARAARARVVVDVEAIDGQRRPVADGESASQAEPHTGAEGRTRSSSGRAAAQAALVALAALLLFGAGYVVAARDRLATWWATPTAPALSVPAMAPDVSPEPRGSQQIIDRARQHLAQGRNEAALRLLTAIAADDPLGPTADRLRADAQRALDAARGVDGRPPAAAPAPARGSASR